MREGIVELIVLSDSIGFSLQTNWPTYLSHQTGILDGIIYSD